MKDDSEKFLSNTYYRLQHTATLKNMLFNYFFDLIYKTDSADWPKELKHKAVVLTGRFDLIAKRGK